MHSRCEYEFHFYTPFGGKLNWLTFTGLQEPVVPAIISSPIDVLSRPLTVERERPVLDFPKSPVTSRAFWFLRFRYATCNVST